MWITAGIVFVGCWMAFCQVVEVVASVDRELANIAVGGYTRA